MRKKRSLLLIRGLLRSLRVLLAVALALILIIFFGARRFFDEERIKAVIVTQLQDVFKRPVQIGAVVLTPSGIKLRNVQIIEKLDVPGQYLMTSDMVLATFQLRPLLRRRLKLDSVRLLSPRIQLIRDENGLWNVSDMFVSSSTRRRDSSGSPALPFSLAAENTIIESGFVKVEDRLKKSSHRFDKVNLAVHQFDTDKPFTFAISFDNVTAVSSRTIHSDWKLKGAMSLASFDWPKAYLRAEQIEISADGRFLRGSGGLTGFFGPSTADLDLKVPALGPAAWEMSLGQAADFHLPASRWRLKLSLLQPGLIEIQRLFANAPPLALKASGLVALSTAGTNVSASVETAPFPMAKAASLRRSWEPFRLTGTALIKGRIQTKSGRLEIAQASLSLKDFSAFLPKARVQAEEISLEAARDFSRIGLAVQKGLVRAYGHTFRDISTSATLLKGDLKLEALSFRWNESSVKLKARVRDISDPKEVAVAGSMDRLSWEDAQSLVEAAFSSAKKPQPAQTHSPKPWVRIFKYVIPKKFPDIAGEISIGSVTHRNFSFKNMALLWNVRGITPTLKQVNGDIKLGFGPGRVNDIPAVQESHKLLKVVFLPFIYMHKMNNLSVFSAATAYPKTLDFNRIEAEYGLRSGLAATRCFFVDSPQVVAYAEGTADLGKERVDMNILTRLTSYRNPLPEWWTDVLGRPAIGFRVRNDLNKPDIDPRLSKMGADEIEQAVGRCKARSKLRHGALAKAMAL